MTKRREYRLDSLVRTALRSGPMRPTPFGLHGRIWRRLEIAALVERERRRFRSALWTASFLTCALIGVAGVALWVWDPMGLVANEVPGAMGFMDSTLAHIQATTADMFSSTGETWVWGVVGTAGVLLLATLGGLGATLRGTRRN